MVKYGPMKRMIYRKPPDGKIRFVRGMLLRELKALQHLRTKK